MLSSDFIFSFSLEIELNAKVWNSMKHAYYSRYSFASLMIFLTVISCLLASELMLSGEINLENEISHYLDASAVLTSKSSFSLRLESKKNIYKNKVVDRQNAAKNQKRNLKYFIQEPFLIRPENS